MYNATPPILQPVKNILRWSEEGKIDPLEGLRDRRVYLQVGRKDGVLGVGPMRALERQVDGLV